MFDILAQTTQPSLENLQQVHQFYEDAWGNLTWMISAMGAFAGAFLLIVGWLLPTLLERGRARTFELSKKDVQDEMRRLIKSETELYKNALKQLADELQQSNDQTHRTINHHLGILWYEMAEAMHKTTGGAWPKAIKYWCYAINSFVAAKYLPSGLHWELITNCLGEYPNTSPAQDIVATVKEVQIAVQETIRLLRSLPQVEPYTILLKKLEFLTNSGE